MGAGVDVDRQVARPGRSVQQREVAAVPFLPTSVPGPGQTQPTHCVGSSFLAGLSVVRTSPDLPLSPELLCRRDVTRTSRRGNDSVTGCPPSRGPRCVGREFRTRWGWNSEVSTPAIRSPLLLRSKKMCRCRGGSIVEVGDEIRLKTTRGSLNAWDVRMSEPIRQGQRAALGEHLTQRAYPGLATVRILHVQGVHGKT